MPVGGACGIRSAACRFAAYTAAAANAAGILDHALQPGLHGRGRQRSRGWHFVM